MTEVKNITTSTFNFGGDPYFRRGSEKLTLGSWGQKKTPLHQANYLAKSGTVSVKNLGKVKVQVTEPYTISWDKFSSGGVKANIKYLKAAGGTGKFSHNAAKKYKLKLVQLSISENQLKKLLNDHANVAREGLDDEGADGRIVSSVFICMEGEIASRVERAGSVKLSAPIGGSGFVVDVGGRASSTSNGTIEVPEDTCFAYGMHKVKKWVKNNGKRLVDNMEDDWVGLG